MKTMKKKRAILSLIIILIIIIIIAVNFLRPVRLYGVDTVELNYEYGDISIHTQLEEEDAARLIEICKGTAINDLSIPSCGFGTAELKFKGKLGTTTLYPACDNCDTMQIGKNGGLFYSIGNDNRAELEKILAKYGAAFPCV